MLRSHAAPYYCINAALPDGCLNEYCGPFRNVGIYIPKVYDKDARGCCRGGTEDKKDRILYYTDEHG